MGPVRHDGASPPSARAYARKRAARIYPAYFVLIVVVLGVYPPVAVAPMDEWLHYLTLTQIYVSGIEIAQLTQVWSLATEVAFYVALPVLAYLAGRRHRGDPDRSARRQWAVLAAMTLTGLGFQLRQGLDHPDAGLVVVLLVARFLDWFALGMALAVVRARLAVQPTASAPYVRIRARSQVTWRPA